MAKIVNLESEVTLTVAQLKTIFQMGGYFEADVNSFDLGNIDEVTEPDFDDAIGIVLDLEFEK